MTGPLFPGNYSTVWIRGRFITMDGQPVRGKLSLFPTVTGGALVNRSAKLIMSSAVFSADTGNDGYVAVQVPATNDPDLTPVNFTYSVTTPIGQMFSIVVPYDTAPLNSVGDPLHGQPVIELIDVVPVGSSGGVGQLLRGIGVQSMVDNGAGGLLITYSDGSTSTIAMPGTVAGPPGPSGPTGPAGPTGPTGPTGGGATKLVDLTDVTTTGAAAGGLLVPTQISGGVPTAHGYRSDRLYPAATDAAIRAAAATLNSSGGGTVYLPEATITLSSPLPVYAGVAYEGVPPVTVPQNVTNTQWMGDIEWNFAGGTVLTGDGTFDAFAANTTDQGVVASDIGNTQISNTRIRNVGLDNFAIGLHIGAKNVMGMVWGEIDNIWVKRCTQWGVKFVNFAHSRIGRIYSCLCQNGQYYGVDFPVATMIPGNSDFGEVYNLVPRDGRDNRLCRGIVFESIANNSMNEMIVSRVQNNGFNRALLSVTATLTSGSTAIAVPDAALFAPHQVVTFTTTANGFTAGYAYVVKSIDTGANTITVGNSWQGAAVSPSGSGTMTVTTYGMANIELTGLRASHFPQIDTEGTTSCGLYTEACSTTQFSVAEAPGTVLVGIVGRSCQFSRYTSFASTSNDFDAGSTSCRLDGAMTTAIQRAVPGNRTDTVAGIAELRLSTSSAGPTPGGDIHSRAAGFLYPNAGMGERIRSQNTAITLGSNLTGDIVFTGSAAATFTLPTIVTDTTIGASHIGCWFDIVNLGTAAVTLATSGSQLFNKVTGLVSITVAAGDAVRVVAVKDAGSTLFWVAKRITLLTT